MLEWFLGMVIIVSIIYAVAKFSDSSDKNRWEKEKMKSKIAELETQTKRQEAVITGLCPQCHQEKGDSLVCSHCRFKFVDGEYCDGCRRFFRYEQLESRRDVDMNWIYECKSCLNKVYRKY